MRILGIDPGSLLMGYGLIDVEGNHYRYISCGTLSLKTLKMPARLKLIFETISELIVEHKPQQFAIERVFMGKNVDSALKLGQARGVAMCAASMQGLEVSEYAAREIKQATTGSGAADKGQIQHMVKVLLGLNKVPGEDAADALATAICHAHHSSGPVAKLQQKIQSNDNLGLAGK
ncbi:Crossover junction endodeoxyribonuclease RuvC [hydrothermal vent metagenome]|uniref:Crossover junction endodeoxyribonuclease RuvC n=1 Tax=hydrothermal vent metagenome TaxID=652676 RepID=A0A3B0YE74_9ZZZZ